MDKPLVRERSAQWRFTDGGAAAAVRAAAAFLEKDTQAPMNPTRRAVRAVEIHHLFVDGAEPEPDPSFWS